MVVYYSADRDFIPNDVQLGGDQSKMVLLTGPNSKSSILLVEAEKISSELQRLRSGR